MQRDAVEKFLDLEAQVNDEEDEDDEEERNEMGMYQNLYYILSLTSKFKMSLLSMAPRKRKRITMPALRRSTLSSIQPRRTII
jgi:hypothetical protein